MVDERRGEPSVQYVPSEQKERRRQTPQTVQSHGFQSGYVLQQAYCPAQQGRDSRTASNLCTGRQTCGWQRAEHHRKVYPVHPPLNYDNDGEEDDFLQHLGHENFWVAHFLAAANSSYTRGDESAKSQDKEKIADRQRKHINAVKQQQLYNYKPHEDSSKDFYTNEWVNARMRLLFREILVYHQGGRSIYGIGGHNNGYGEDRKLKFTARLRVIVEAMRADKRVVMDVIEGRGVAALAMNPKRFADRKNSNNKCNENKKRKLDLVGGESVDGGEEGGGVVSVKAPSVTLSSGTRSRRRAGQAAAARNGGM